MKNLFLIACLAGAVSIIAFGGYAVGQALNVNKVVSQTFGDFNPTGGGTYYLSSTISSTQSTITLSSFTEPVSGTPYTMSYLNSAIEYATIGPQTTQSEFISFTGITQNADGSATLTGVVRGLSRSYPYTANSTFQLPHAGQTRFILSNPPQLTNQYGALLNANTWSAVNTFTTGANPKYTSVPSTYGNTDLVAYQTLINTAISGAGTSTESSMGIVQLASNSQVGTSVASSTQGRPLVIENRFATSTPGAQCFNGSWPCIPVGGANGQISSMFIATSSPYIWGALHIFNLGFLAIASSTFSATTTITASSVTNNALVLNTIPYAFPSLLGASSTVLATDAAGKLTWEIGITGATPTTTTASLVTTTGGVVTKAVSCVAPKLVSGGGYTGLPVNAGGSSFYIVEQNYANTTSSWTVSVECISNGCTAGTLTVSAICVNP